MCDALRRQVPQGPGAARDALPGTECCDGAGGEWESTRTVEVWVVRYADEGSASWKARFLFFHVGGRELKLAERVTCGWWRLFASFFV